jgi:hypothetical protein
MSSIATYTVYTKAALLNALAIGASGPNLGTSVRIVLAASIPIDTSITIPERHTIVFGPHGFIKRASGTVVFYGGLVADHRQIFFDFLPGDITGTFKGEPARPAWWGAYASATPPSPTTTVTADRGILCAIQAKSPQHGHVIELDAGYYAVAAPIDLASTDSLLRGQGPNRTFIYSVSAWTPPVWHFDTLWGANSHSSVIWIGGKILYNTDCYNTGVEKLTVNCYYASVNNSSKYVSGISTYGYIQEQTTVENVNVSGFSGYGIGGCSGHLYNDANAFRDINGLCIRNFWITAAMKPEAIPIALGNHSRVASVKSGTIDMNTGNVRQLSRIGIWAQGNHTSIDSVHIEGVRYGVMVSGSSSTGESVSVSNVDLLTGVDYDMVASGAGTSLNILTTGKLTEAQMATGSGTPGYLSWSTVLMIMGPTDSQAIPALPTPSTLTGISYNPAKWSFENYHTRVHAHNIMGENAKFAIRDYAMGVHVPTWGANQNGSHTGAVAHYTRTNVYNTALATPVPYWGTGDDASPLRGDFTLSTAGTKTYRSLLI